jgi:hypothetical protein
MMDPDNLAPLPTCPPEVGSLDLSENGLRNGRSSDIFFQLGISCIRSMRRSKDKPPTSYRCVVSECNRNAQEGCRNGGGIPTRAFVLAVEQFFQLLLQIICPAVLFCGFECIHGRPVVFPEFIHER